MCGICTTRTLQRGVRSTTKVAIIVPLGMDETAEWNINLMEQCDSVQRGVRSTTKVAIIVPLGMDETAEWNINLMEQCDSVLTL